MTRSVKEVAMSLPRKSFLLPVLLLLFTAVLLLLLSPPAMAAPTARYVDGAGGVDSGDCSQPTSPCATISYALSEANGKDTVIVAEGHYKENLIIEDNIDLLGGYEAGYWAHGGIPYSSVIDGQQLGSVVRYDGGFGGTLDGFKITGGKADEGGGVYNDTGSPILKNLWITDNVAEDGGGVYFNKGQASISDSKIEKNKASDQGGGILIRFGSSALSGVMLSENEAEHGGGIYLNNTGKVSLTGSELRENKGKSQSGAIHLDNTDLTVEDSIFADNNAGAHGGAMTAYGSQLKVVNGLLTGNNSTAGPANIMAMNASEVLFINSTLADNAPSGHQAVIRWGAAGTFILKNSIMWNNSLFFQADPPCSGCFVADYSNIQGYTDDGTHHNIEADPLFRSAANDDYRLQKGSPCIDAGTASGGFVAPEDDLDGNPRDSKPDMGAYEYTVYVPDLPFKVYLPVIMSK